MWWNGLTLPLAHLGVLLQLLREHRRMNLLALVAALEALGDELSVATYMRMEAGVYFPEDGARFLNAYTKAMRLSHEEVEIVVTQWVFDLLRRELHEDLAWEILGGKLGATRTPQP